MTFCEIFALLSVAFARASPFSVPMADWALAIGAAAFGAIAIYFLGKFGGRSLDTHQRELKKRLDERKERIERESDRLERISAIVAMINSEFSFEKVLEMLLRVPRALHGVDMAIALVRDHQIGSFRIHAAFGWDPAELIDLTFTEEQVEKLYLEGAREFFPDLFLLDRDAGADRHRVTLTVRIRRDDRSEGFLVFENPETRESVDLRDLELLHDLKEHILSAFIRARSIFELERLNRSKNEFIGIAAHDLRTPLGVIEGWVTLVKDQIESGPIDEKRVIEQLDRVQSAAVEMGRLVNDLLDISAIESGQVNLERSRQQLGHFIESSVAVHRPIADRKGIEIVLEKSRTQTDVIVDGGRITEVIENLLSNAIKFTPSGGEVRVSCERVNGDVVTHIRDNGQGLSDDDLKHIFRSFRKLSARPTGGESSTGLGLAIVKKLVEVHGGSVWVRSKKGSGSTFSFALPAAR